MIGKSDIVKGYQKLDSKGSVTWSSYQTDVCKGVLKAFTKLVLEDALNTTKAVVNSKAWASYKDKMTKSSFWR